MARMNRYYRPQYGAALTEAAVAIALLLVVFLVSSFLMIEGAKRRAEQIDDAVARPLPCEDASGEGGFLAGGEDSCK